MNRIRSLILAALLVLLPGCSLLEGVQQVDQTLDYVNGATAYVNEAASWAQSIPVQAEQAVLVPEARDELIRKLEQVLAEIQTFNRLEAPAAFRQVHDQIALYNDTLQQEITTYVDNLKQNVIDPLALKDTQIIRLFEEISQTVGTLQQLGQYG